MTDKQCVVLDALGRLDDAPKGVQHWRVADELIDRSPWSGASSQQIVHGMPRILTTLERLGLVVSSRWQLTVEPYSRFRRWRLSDRGRSLLGIAPPHAS